MINGGDPAGDLVAALESSFEVVEYSSPVTALLHIGEQPPDAIVLASELGPLSGAEIIEALRGDENTRHVRAILLEGDDRDRDAALAAGASAHVRASDLAGLRDTLEALMGVRH